MEDVIEEFGELIRYVLEKLDQLGKEVGRIEKDLIKIEYRLKRLEQRMERR